MLQRFCKEILYNLKLIKMKRLDLNAIGVSEMTEMEMKNTEGGFWGWLVVAGLIGLVYLCSRNPDNCYC